MTCAGVACCGGAPLVVVAYMVVHGSGVVSTVGTFVVLVARIVGFAGVGVVVARDGRGGAGARRPVAGDVGVGRSESLLVERSRSRFWVIQQLPSASLATQ